MFISFCMRTTPDNLELIHKMKITEPGIHPLEGADCTSIIVFPHQTVPVWFGEDRDDCPCLLMISEANARDAVNNDMAAYEVPKVLIMTMEAYLADNDVINRPGEVDKAKNSGEKWAAVAMVGKARGPITVTRNLANYKEQSGDYTMAQLIRQAKDAFENPDSLRRVLIQTV